MITCPTVFTPLDDSLYIVRGATAYELTPRILQALILSRALHQSWSGVIPGWTITQPRRWADIDEGLWGGCYNLLAFSNLVFVTLDCTLTSCAPSQLYYDAPNIRLHGEPREDGFGCRGWLKYTTTLHTTRERAPVVPTKVLLDPSQLLLSV